MNKWNFITYQGLVLLYISQNPQCTMRDMATALKVTERTVQRALKDLEEAGYLTWQRTGVGNIYLINRTRKLKNDLTKEVIAGDLLSLLSYKKKRKSRIDTTDQNIR